MNVAESLWISGAGHALAAKALTDLEGDRAFNGRMSASIYLLIGNALELTLKAAFVGLGGNESDLISKIGHRLKRALASAENLGFAPNPTELTWLVEHMHEPHARHYFRYLGEDDIALPDLPATLEILDWHVRAVGKLVLNREQ